MYSMKLDSEAMPSLHVYISTINGYVNMYTIKLNQACTYMKGFTTVHDSQLPVETFEIQYVYTVSELRCRVSKALIQHI